MAEIKSAETMVCQHCNGTGRVKATQAVAPWKRWQERVELAKKASVGDRWVQIKSGRVVVITAVYGRNGCLHLKHKNGRTTSKWHHYFGAEYTPETPPNE